MEKIKLLSCPFCGSLAEFEIKNNNATNHNTKIRVGCTKTDCQANFEEFIYGKPKQYIIECKKDDLIKKWNSRI